MIVCGYPGIGKTRVSENRNSVIDLDSSIFDHVDGWADTYCRVAEQLSKQDNTVFVSTHPEVIEHLKEFCSEPVIVVYPDCKLKDLYVRKLKERADKSGSDKDMRAYEAVRDHFDEYIYELADAPFRKIVINKDNCLYRLIDWIEECESNFPGYAFKMWG